MACHGHSGQAYCTGLTLAERLCRTAVRIDPPGEGNADADRRQEAEGSGREEAGGQVAAEVGVGAPNFRSIRQQRCLEVASRPAMSLWSMGRVGLIDITVGNAARLGASQRSTTRRCASHHIATQRASRWGHPGGSRAFSAAQRQLSPTCLNPCLVPDDCFYRYQTGSLYWQKYPTAQVTRSVETQL
jgi:hypothetical protein